MFTPKYPAPDVSTITTAGTPAQTPAAPVVAATYSAPAPVPVASTRPLVQISPAAVATGVGAVLVVGSVLVSMLLAVAVTAASVAVCAVVLRSLLNNQHKNR